MSLSSICQDVWDEPHTQDASVLFSQPSLDGQREAAFEMVETGNLRGAEKLLRRIWAAYERMQPPDDVMRARVLHDFAAVLCSLQRGYEAEELCRAALLVRSADLRCSSAS